jgi:hypothetical protein
MKQAGERETRMLTKTLLDSADKIDIGPAPIKEDGIC